MYKLVKASVPDDAFQDMIIEYFLRNKGVEDEDIHQWAASMRMTPDQLEEHIFKLLADLLSVVGEAYDTPDAAFDRVQLIQGIEEESKNFKAPMAKMIAKFYLNKNPQYYTAPNAAGNMPYVSVANVKENTKKVKK